jgi:predicted transglutaminase-like cysteine proteinase
MSLFRCRAAILAAFLTIPLFAAPAFSAGDGGLQPPPPECPAGQVWNKKLKKCVDAELVPISTEPGVIPNGFHGFCVDYPTECERVEPDTISLTVWRATLDRINREVNASITYTVETVDSWNVGPEKGDCDDYTVTKRQKLIEAGVPRGAMRAAYVLTAEETNHIFLVVSTVQGDFVLDNNDDEVVEIDRKRILRLSIQDAADPRVWWKIY